MDTRQQYVANSSTTATFSVFVKEGVVVRKHLLENATQKAKHRDWRECYLVVADGEMKMYAVGSAAGYQQQQGMNSNKVSSSDVNRRSLLSGVGFTTTMIDSLTSKSSNHDSSGTNDGVS
jgi:hypothetical protein